MNDNDSYNDPPEITDALNRISQKEGNYTSPHKAGLKERADKSRDSRETFSVRPIAYDVTGATIYGKTPLPKQDTVDDEKPSLPIIIRGDQIPDTPVQFLWDNRFSRQFGIIGGRQGLGKSMFVAYLAARITNADVHSWGDGAPCPTGIVMYFVPEGGSSATKQRIRNMGGDVKNLVIYSGIGSGRTRPDGTVDIDREPVVSDTANLTRAIDAAKKGTGQKVHLIIIDPITDFMGDIRQNDNGEVTRVLRGLDYLAVERNICIIGVKHLKKDPNTTAAVYSIGGSSAFTSKPRFVYLLDQTPDSRKAELEGKTIERRLILAPTKSNDFAIKNSIEFTLAGKDDNFHVELCDLAGSWTGDSLQSELSKINGGTAKGRGRPANDERNAEIKSLLESGMSVKDVMEEMEKRGQPVGKNHVYGIQKKLNEEMTRKYSDFADYRDDEETD